MGCRKPCVRIDLVFEILETIGSPMEKEWTLVVFKTPSAFATVITLFVDWPASDFTINIKISCNIIFNWYMLFSVEYINNISFDKDYIYNYC